MATRALSHQCNSEYLGQLAKQCNAGSDFESRLLQCLCLASFMRSFLYRAHHFKAADATPIGDPANAATASDGALGAIKNFSPAAFAAGHDFVPQGNRVARHQGQGEVLGEAVGRLVAPVGFRLKVYTWT